MLEATGSTCAWLYAWPRGRVPKPRDPSTSWVSGDEKYGLGPSEYALVFGLPPPESLPRSKSNIKPLGKRKRDGLFYGPLAWKPLTQEERDRELMRDIFGSDGSDTE